LIFYQRALIVWLNRFRSVGDLYSLKACPTYKLDISSNIEFPKAVISRIERKRESTIQGHGIN